MDYGIFQRHNRALISFFGVEPRTRNTWVINNGYNTFTVTKESDEICCDLICNICNICVHNYSCTCPDHENGNLCKHVHYIVIHKGVNIDVSSAAMRRVGLKVSAHQEVHSIKDQLNEILSRLHEEILSLEVEDIERNEQTFNEALRHLRNGLNLLLSIKHHHKSMKEGSVGARSKTKIESQTSVQTDVKVTKDACSAKILKEESPDMVEVMCNVKKEPQEMEEVLCDMVKEQHKKQSCKKREEKTTRKHKKYI